MKKFKLFAFYFTTMAMVISGFLMICFFLHAICNGTLEHLDAVILSFGALLASTALQDKLINPTKK